MSLGCLRISYRRDGLGLVCGVVWCAVVCGCVCCGCLVFVTLVVTSLNLRFRFGGWIA